MIRHYMIGATLLVVFIALFDILLVHSAFMGFNTLSAAIMILCSILISMIEKGYPTIWKDLWRLISWPFKRH